MPKECSSIINTAVIIIKTIILEDGSIDYPKLIADLKKIYKSV